MGESKSDSSLQLDNTNPNLRSPSSASTWLHGLTQSNINNNYTSAASVDRESLPTQSSEGEEVGFPGPPNPSSHIPPTSALALSALPSPPSVRASNPPNGLSSSLGVAFQHPSPARRTTSMQLRRASSSHTITTHSSFSAAAEAIAGSLPQEDFDSMDINSFREDAELGEVESEGEDPNESDHEESTSQSDSSEEWDDISEDDSRSRRRPRGRPSISPTIKKKGMRRR